MRVAVRAFLSAVLLCTLTAMVWAGGLYYWHFKVERIIRYMEDGGDDATLPLDMENTLHRAGCRGLPNLVRASKPDAPAPFLAFTTLSAVKSINRVPALTSAECTARYRRSVEMVVHNDDALEVRAKKVAKLQQWWAEHGAETHQWWRFWSGNCRYPEL
jgi:hypothetical protein